ncbi:MAG TPA: hypothetical protein VES20_00575 [Bryobacteraceae bacterium]|nr:hypothetical protein [Bryobacteraceae bacterium]
MAIASGTRTVVGVFNSVNDAQNAVRELESRGISRDQISLVANKNAVGYDTMSSADKDKASDVVADAGIGAAIGGVGGLLLSAAGALTIPVIGPILAAGPIAAALTGAGIGAAAGGLIGALTESGIPEEHARHYAEGIRRGDVLVTVHAPEGREDEVSDVLDSYNAVDVDERVRAWQDRGWSGYRDDAQPLNDDEFRRERSYYGSTSSLTGETGIGVDRQRSALHSDRDDLTPPVGNTPGSNWAGDVGTSGTVGTTGLSGAGLGTTSSSHRAGDDRGMFDKAGDKMREWKEDLKETGRDLRDEARETSHQASHSTRGTMDSTENNLRNASRELRQDTRELRHDTSRTTDRAADRTSDAVNEAGRDLREAGRDIRDVLTGRTGTQAHDVAEERREAERRRRSRIYDRTMM